MGRVIAFALMLSVGRLAAADESVVAKLIPDSDVVRRLSIDAGGCAVVRRAWDGPGMLIVATKRAPNRAQLDRLRVSYSMDEAKHAYLTVGERAAEILRPLPQRTCVDLAVYVPARLLPAWERDPEDDVAPLDERIANGTGVPPATL
jgi:hypothetical protein